MQLKRWKNQKQERKLGIVESLINKKGIDTVMYVCLALVIIGFLGLLVFLGIHAYRTNYIAELREAKAKMEDSEMVVHNVIVYRKEFFEDGKVCYVTNRGGIWCFEALKRADTKAEVDGL